MKVSEFWVLFITSFNTLVSCDYNTNNYLVTASMGQKGVDAGMEFPQKEDPKWMWHFPYFYQKLQKQVENM